jgi:hypothetical protein
MAVPNKAARGKRDRERAAHEKRQEKEEKRALRKEQKKSRASLSDTGEDPDIAGIIPGPQKPLAG